jgi:hypothetical protein
MANPFEITPANPLQALMMGMQGYKQGKEVATENRRSSALAQLMGTGGQSGANPDYAGVARTLAASGDIAGATQIAGLAKNLAGPESTDEIKEYNLYKQQGGKLDFFGFKTELKKAGATRVNTNINPGETEFDKTLGKKAGERFDEYIKAGDSARGQLTDIANMREISSRLGNPAAAAELKEKFGPYAEALGVPVEGLSDIQAYSSIIQRLAPQQRAPGSGSTSDIEFKGFVKSLPGASQHPAAREMTLNTMEALRRDEIARGEIARKVQTRELNRMQAEQQLRSLPDPMQGFSEWRKKNPQLYGQISSGKPGAPASNPRVDDLLNKYAPKQ